MADRYPLSEKALKDWLNKTIVLLRKSLDKGGRFGKHNNSGSLQQSIASNANKIRVKDGKVIGEIEYNDYGDVLNDGRRPGSTPPFSPILHWVKTKLSTDRSLSKSRQKSADWIRAKRIQEKIGEKGTEGSGWIDRVLTDEREEELAEIVMEAYAQDLLNERFKD